jgi:tetratricopeptide (TPR) repeat protein
MKPAFKYFSALFLMILLAACGAATEAQIKALEKLLNDKNFKEAVLQADKILKDNPKLHQVYVLRGVANFELKNLTEASEDFTKALEINKESYKPFYNRGLVRIELKLYEKALEDFSESIKRDPAVSDLYLNRGTAFMYLGRYNEALADFIQGLKFKPNDKALLFNKAMASAKTGNYEAALHDLHECIALDPDMAKAHYYLAVYHFETEKKPSEEICEHLNRALSLGFSQAEAMQKEICAQLEQ